MIWCESAIVPRLARTLSSVSPPRDESVASGVRNSAPGEGEDAEALVWSADKGLFLPEVGVSESAADEQHA